MAVMMDTPSVEEIELGILGKQIRTHDIAVKALRSRRREIIRNLLQQGVSERELAKMSGLSGPYIHELKYGKRKKGRK
jgi:hypothetical protein